jgi:hypothetical protein
MGGTRVLKVTLLACNVRSLKAPSTGASTPPQKGSLSDALASKRADGTLPIPLNVGFLLACRAPADR